ncbi:TPA: hypothetical protein MDE43_004743 [Klebsiella pneumoniae]|nr:hypothetical protein [Klebsiella pneumoniae]
MPQKTKQEVWQAAKEEKVEHFITAIAKAFPDAIYVVHVKSDKQNAWCYANSDVK